MWEEFELVLSIGPEDKIYAKKDFLDDVELDVRLLELGEE